MFALTDLFSVAGRVALVTGGATGLGRICAEALLSAGARVLIASRKAEACQAAARELSAIGPCEGFGGTVADEAGVAALAGEVRARTDKLHILVNNAGVSWARLRDLSVEGLGAGDGRQRRRPVHADARPCAAAVRRRFDRAAGDGRQFGSVMGAVTQAETPTPIRRRRRRSIISPASSPPSSRRQVTVNAIAPGPFATNMTRFAVGDEAGAARSAKPCRWAAGRPEDIAGTLLYLAGRGGAYTSGAIVPVDGGVSAFAPPPLFGEGG